MPDWLLSLVVGLSSAVVGGGIAGYFSWKATTRAHEYQSKQEKDYRAQRLQNLLQALHDELETIWERYQRMVGVQVEALKSGEPFPYHFPIFEDYFVIYNSNAELLGEIPDSDLRKLIVVTFTSAKGLVDSYRHNNFIIEKLEREALIFNETKAKAHETSVQYYKQYLADYAGTIKEIHEELKENVARLDRELRKRGVLSAK